MIVPSEQSPAREYFLKCLQTPEIIWGIRGVMIAAVIVIIICYILIKKKRKEEE